MSWKCTCGFTNEGGSRCTTCQRSNPKGGVMWTRDEACAFLERLCRLLEPVNWYAGITGSVVERGSSRKDLDMIIYPFRTDRPMDKEQAYSVFRALGLQRFMKTSDIHAIWRKLGSGDDKQIEAWRNKKTGQRVDFFFLR